MTGPASVGLALDALDAEKRGGEPKRILGALSRLSRHRFADAASLLRFHEALLFLRAYPPNAAVLRACDRLLSSFGARVRSLDAAEVDLTPLRESDAAGVAGVSLTMSYGHDATRWLAARRPRDVTIDWDGYEGGARLASALTPVIPLLEEEALVDVDVPYRRWIDAARPPRERELAWLLGRFRDRTDLYDALGLFVTWRVADRDSRTRLRAPARETFFHDGPLLSRRDVDLARELSRPALVSRRLSTREGERLLEIARTVLAARYRELWCFTHGDPGAVISASPGRGVELVLFGIERGRRLPLRSGFGLLVLKNGVPLGYGDVFALFERADATFNVFPTFREGESAWVYAQALRLYRAALGARVFSVEPYQIGAGNDEALASGAFWFYRKLGFRSTDPSLEALARREEKRLASDPARRSTRRLLARLAGAPLVFEHGPAPGAWDGFHVREVGIAVNRRARGPRAADDRRLLAEIAEAKRARTELQTLRRLGARPDLRARVLELGKRR